MHYISNAPLASDLIFNEENEVYFPHFNQLNGQSAALAVLHKSLPTLPDQPHKIFITRETAQAPVSALGIMNVQTPATDCNRAGRRHGVH